MIDNVELKELNSFEIEQVSGGLAPVVLGIVLGGFGLGWTVMGDVLSYQQP